MLWIKVVVEAETSHDKNVLQVASGAGMESASTEVSPEEKRDIRESDKQGLILEIEQV